MKIDVLSIGAFPEATNAELAKRFAVTRYLQRPAPDALSADLKNRIRGIATEANRGADRALIAALPKLEVIAVFGVGTDGIDLAAARERNIPVTNTPGILTDEVADLAIGLMLASARQILFADRYVRATAAGRAKVRSRSGAASVARPWACSGSAASAAPLPIAAPPSACA
jgi:lactate dehydrogenase-like 2-hydroxyacid dehydrogenase